MALFSPLLLIESSSSGKKTDGNTIAGWRSVRITERCASSRTWLTPARAPRARGLTLQRAAGLGEEDVVERGRVQLELLDLDALGVERAHHLGELGVSARQPHGRALGRAGHGLAEAGQHLPHAAELAPGPAGPPRRSGGRSRP